MKLTFYSRLAWTGMWKNRRLYLPYILSCIGMVIMYYILHSLSFSPLLGEMRGGSSIGLVLVLGRFVIAFFALLFLLYTNSFLIRQRYKEFGLYNVLGMDKRGIGRIVTWEALISAAVSITCGIGLGAAFSKLAELGLLNMINGEVDYRFRIFKEAILWTAGIFGLIYLLILIRSLCQVRRSNPLELMHSEKTGEKPPKANWAMAVLGILILGAAYYLAVSIESPLTALVIFFIAVIMVIIATYMIFISGSVALCRALQKNKKYYYKKNHFVSVSSMAFRMKRNGAGLASVCILCTMVLVMLSSTASLYFGVQDALRSRFPRDTAISLQLWETDNLTNGCIDEIRAGYEKVFSEHDFTPEDLCEYRCASISGMKTGNRIDPQVDTSSVTLNFSGVYNLFFISAADYNGTMGTHLDLDEGTALLHTFRCEYDEESIEIKDVCFDIIGRLDEFIPIESSINDIVPTLMLVIPSYDELKSIETGQTDSSEFALSVEYYYGYNSSADPEETIQIYREQKDAFMSVQSLKKYDGFSYSSGCIELERNDFVATNGGMFFLGIMLSAIFIFAAAMIIYYKQVSEGYEDRSRFAIMRKVGMTPEDIKRSIDSQVLTVFFAPIIIAGLHLAFAFPLVWKILMLFDMRNLSTVIGITVISYLIFALAYALIYKATARAYYSIVSSDSPD